MFQGYFADLKKLAAQQDRSADQRLQEYISDAAEQVAALRRWQPLMAEFYSVATRHESTRLFLQKYYVQYIDLLAQLIQQGIDQGEFRSIQAREAALLMVSTIEGLILLCALGVCDDNWGAQLENSLTHILASFRMRRESTIQSP
jgi:hypothetical protein